MQVQHDGTVYPQFRLAHNEDSAAQQPLTKHFLSMRYLDSVVSWEAVDRFFIKKSTNNNGNNGSSITLNKCSALQGLIKGCSKDLNIKEVCRPLFKVFSYTNVLFRNTRNIL